MRTPRPAVVPIFSRPSSGQGGMAMLFMLLMTGLFAFAYLLAYQGDRVDARMPAKGSNVPNLKNLLAIGLSSGKNLTITEEQINGYLAATLRAKQGGPLAGKASIERVMIQLEDGEFRLILVRKLFGRPHTVSLHFQASREGVGKDSLWNLQIHSGKVGKLPVAGGLLQLVLAPARQIASLYPSELRILQHASSLRIEKGRLLLGPVVVNPSTHE